MWYNELLFVLMFVALIGMGVMALIVKLNMSHGENAIEKKVKVPEKIQEPKKKVSAEPIAAIIEPIAAVTEPEHEVELEPIEAVEIDESIFKPVIIQEMDPDPILAPMTEPSFTPISEEPAEPVIEPRVEPVEELTAEPLVNPIPDPQIPPHEPSPPEIEARRESENQFFDLRYEYATQSTTEDVPDMIDEAPSLDFDEEQKAEPLPGVVTCPHCKSEVPQTLYCIYCGNSLTAKPVNGAK